MGYVIIDDDMQRNPLSRVDSQKSKPQPYRQPRRQPHLYPQPKCGHNITADNIPSLLE